MLIVLMALTSCDAMFPAGPQDDELLDGPVDRLSLEQSQTFIHGDVAFNDLVFTSQTGLGPTFVASSCGSCHAGDGKGHPFTTLTRFGQNDSRGNLFLDQGGPQLQNRALPGYVPELIPEGAPFARFIPPAVTGLGFLDFVTDATILSNADPNDADGDGISGVASWITLQRYIVLRRDAVIKDGTVIGRYGRKAATYDLTQQTVDAFNQDIGITSVYSPIDVYSKKEIDPEVSTKTINDIVFYLQTLKAPIQRTPSDAVVVKGKATFMTVGCGSCHLPTMRTGDSPIRALSNVEFHPYTDMLLHDMGPGLNDGYTEGSATSSEWRTTPLWGLGLSARSQGGRYFLMHDGRATSIQEAISMHGGEAQRSRDNFFGLSREEQQAILKFLESL